DPYRVDQLMFARSTDYGATFEPPVILDTVPAKGAGGSEMQNPTIRVSGINVYVAWSAMHDAESDVFFRVSNDNGSTFGDTVNLSNNSGNSWLLGMHTSGNNIFILWLDSTWGFSDLYFRASVDSGASFGSTINISNNLGNVAQATWSVNEDYVHVLWMNDGAEYGRYADHEIFYTRSPPVSSLPVSNSLDVSIDLMPSSDQNLIDCSTNKGLVKVLILGEEDFDASTVDVSTVDLEGILVQKNKIRIKDFDSDGDLDALIKFRKAHLCEYINLSIQSVGITLYGRTNDGQQFKGTDSILG
ncbi:MAG: sialidase family protein, partial [Nitrososphaerales archaeon]